MNIWPHLIQFGWPALVVAAVLFVLAVPPALRWIRFEIELSRRVRRYEERMEAARVARVKW